MSQNQKQADLQQWKTELPAFQEETRKFYAGELSVREYKGISGGFGSYAQRGGKASMLRLRLSGGRITPKKLAFIGDCIEKYRIKRVHFTTCQTIQLHDLQPEALFAIMEEALKVGIVTRGGGGDFPRNAMVSPLSGVEPGEYFDVMPWAEAAGDYLMTLIKEKKLPRKLKVGFSNGPANLTHATFRDLGFAARPDKTFDVYSAGGLGNNPKMGLKVAEAVEPQKILYYIRAMWETFIAYGNYELRSKARTRYMQDTLGEEGYVSAYQEKLAEVFHSGLDLDVEAAPVSFTKTGDGSTAKGMRILPQKQEGLYSVLYHPIGGMPAPKKLVELARAVCKMQDTELRLAPDESVYIINLTGKEAQEMVTLTADGSRTLFETSVACIGSVTCQQGLRDSQGLIGKAVAAVREAGLKDGSLPQIHISGCVSSCGTHQIGSIGFHGGVKSIDKVPKPAFTLHIYGCDLQGQERFGKQAGMILEENIPDFLVEVGKAVETAGMTFEEWHRASPGALEAIAANYLVP